MPVQKVEGREKHYLVEANCFVVYVSGPYRTGLVFVVPDAFAKSMLRHAVEDRVSSSQPVPIPLLSDGLSSLSIDGNVGTSSDDQSVGKNVEPATKNEVTYRTYKDEDDIPVIVALIAPELSEPYSIYCYRYFLHGWPQLCILAHHADSPVGVIVCKQELHKGKLIRGYIAMLSMKAEFRNLGIATTLVQKAIHTMKREGAQEIVLETEVSNKGALRLYERLGFMRTKRLYRFYLNSSDAFQLCLPIPEEEWQPPLPDSQKPDQEKLAELAEAAGMTADPQDYMNDLYT